MPSKRIVMIEPGDVLLIGNAGDQTAETDQVVSDWAESLDIRIAVFAGPIDIDVLKRADNA